MQCDASLTTIMSVKLIVVVFLDVMGYISAVISVHLLLLIIVFPLFHHLPAVKLQSTRIFVSNRLFYGMFLNSIEWHTNSSLSRFFLFVRILLRRMVKVNQNIDTGNQYCFVQKYNLKISSIVQIQYQVIFKSNEAILFLKLLYGCAHHLNKISIVLAGE